LLQRVENRRESQPTSFLLCGYEGRHSSRRSGLNKGKGLEAVLTRYGTRHFHVGEVSSGSPQWRSGVLVFAEVLEKEFRIAAISDHRVMAHNPKRLATRSFTWLLMMSFENSATF
jgi:hypothetical protein